MLREWTTLMSLTLRKRRRSLSPILFLPPLYFESSPYSLSQKLSFPFFAPPLFITRILSCQDCSNSSFSLKRQTHVTHCSCLMQNREEKTGHELWHRRCIKTLRYQDAAYTFFFLLCCLFSAWKGIIKKACALWERERVRENEMGREVEAKCAEEEMRWGV